MNPWRSFRTAAWLGWQIESNWTDPLLFAIYSIVKPIAGASILVVIYAVVTHGNFASPVFPWMFLGTALYQYVAALMTGMTLAVIDDRERYRMLKYVFVTPTPFPLYMVARGMSRLLTGSFSVWITVLFGVLFLGVRFSAEHFNGWLFTAGFVDGIVLLTALGVILGSVVLTVESHSESFGDAVAGALYLFSGAAFPLTVLPGWLQPLGSILPVSTWLEVMRRSMLGAAPGDFGTFNSLGDGALMLRLVLLTAAYVAAAAGVAWAGSWVARERGLLDKVSHY